MKTTIHFTYLADAKYTHCGRNIEVSKSYRSGVRRRQHDVQTTTDVQKVSCKQCLAILHRQNYGN